MPATLTSAARSRTSASSRRSARRSGTRTILRSWRGNRQARLPSDARSGAQAIPAGGGAPWAPPPARPRGCRLLLLAVAVGGGGLRGGEALGHGAHGVAAGERRAVGHRAGEARLGVAGRDPGHGDAVVAHEVRPAVG